LASWSSTSESRTAREARARRTGSSPLVLPEDRFRQQGREEVFGDEFTGVIDEEAAVDIAVPGDPEVGARLAHLVDDEAPVLGKERVSARGPGSRRRAPRTSFTCSMGNVSSRGPTIGPAMPLPPSSTTLSGRMRPGLDVQKRRLAESIAHVLATGLARRRNRRPGVAVGDDVAQLADPGVS
jgi:hypothetical protein